LHAVGAAEPRRLDPGGQDRVVARMKNAIAQTGGNCQQRHYPDVAGKPEEQNRRRIEPSPVISTGAGPKRSTRIPAAMARAFRYSRNRATLRPGRRKSRRWVLSTIIRRAAM